MAKYAGSPSRACRSTLLSCAVNWCRHLLPGTLQHSPSAQLARLDLLLAIPLLGKHALFVLRDPTAAGMRPMLEQMVKAALLTNILFAVGLVFS